MLDVYRDKYVGEKTEDGTTTYGTEYSAVLNNNNFFATQFHPEKSGAVGERILENFMRL